MITASVICTVYGITALIVACIVLKLEKPFWLFLRVPYLTCSSQMSINLAMALLLFYYIGQVNA
jgi:hypothetical protein